MARDVLLTYGPTRAYLDDVRYLANLSTGRLGGLLVPRLARAGFRVHLVRGKGAVQARLPKSLARLVRDEEIETVDDLIASVRRILSETQPFAIIHAMAVLDYVPKTRQAGKISSGKEDLTLHLKPTPKVVKIIRGLAPKSLLVSFKLESGLSERDLLGRGRDALKRSQSDYVVVNDLTQIHGDDHAAMILDKEAGIVARSRTKQGLAQAIVQVLRGENYDR